LITSCDNMIATVLDSNSSTSGHNHHLQSNRRKRAGFLT